MDHHRKFEKLTLDQQFESQDSIHGEHLMNNVELRGENKSGRRSFLRQATAAVGVVGVASAVITNLDGIAEAQTSDGRVSIAQQLRLVRRHENAHVAFLVNALGNKARPKPTFKNLTSTNLTQFLTLARALENTGVGAYLGAAPAILDRGILASAGSIALVEARHAGMFNSIQSRPMTENAFNQELDFERALTASEVASLAGPYIASLNGGEDVTYSTTPSAANDISILNFALALEYLEAEYYNINVPRFYP